jgi:signal peptidase II
MQAEGRTSLSIDNTPALRPRWVLFLSFAVMGYAVDMASKQWALRSLAEQDIEVVGQWLRFNLTFNPGAAFSFATSVPWLLTVIAIVAGVSVSWIARKVQNPGWAIALGLLLAGICGNLTNRLFSPPRPFFGHVVDFIQVPNFPVFNVADICINTSAALIIVLSFRGIHVDGTRDREPE